MNSASQDKSVAVQAEVLYLLNLLLLPGLAFVLLLWLAHRHRQQLSRLNRIHLHQSIYASLWAGALLMLVTLIIIGLGGFQSPYTWMLLILYFISCHSMLILFGVLGLARALAGLPYRYPLPGSGRWQ